MNKYEKCVMAVKSKQLKSCEKRKWKGSGCVNPWAVCTKTVGRPTVRRRSRSRSTKRKPIVRRRSRSRRKSRKPAVRRKSRLTKS
jgi:hypothetical protein